MAEDGRVFFSWGFHIYFFPFIRFLGVREGGGGGVCNPLIIDTAGGGGRDFPPTFFFTSLTISW